MSSYLLACWVNRDSGEPDTGDHKVKHVVRVGPNPNMPVVEEFSSGGPLSHVACAPSCIQSRLIEVGIDVSIEFIESLAGTTLADGTGFPGCIRALDYWHIGSSETSDAPAGYIMNPMLNHIVDISQFPVYFAARQGGVDALVMDDPLPIPPPPIPTPIPEEDDVTTVAIRSAGTPDPKGPGACYLVKDAVFGPKRWITSQGDLPGYLKACGLTAPTVIDAFILDRMEEGPDINLVASPPQP